MKVVRPNEVAKESFESSLFTGPAVTRQPIARDSQDYNMNIISFGKGVRNKLHTHGSDQVLIVTSGRGIVATEDEEHFVAVGDIVLVPAGEKHWHGATKDSDFAHIAITRAGSSLTQIEK